MLSTLAFLSFLSLVVLGESKQKECTKVLIPTAVAQSPGAGFCNTWAINNAAALEIADANADAAGYISAYANRPIAVNGQTISLNPQVYAAWPNDLPAVGSVGPFVKNVGERNTVFTDICLWRSPARTRAQCNPAIPSTCFRVINYPPPPSRPPYAWLELAKGTCPFSYPDSAVLTVSQAPAPGSILGFVTLQCAGFRYAAGSTYVVLTDEWKNTYIMHAAGSPVLVQDMDVESIELPRKWKIEKRVAEQEIIVWPLSWDSDACFHVILRDHQGNGYHQYTFGESAGNAQNNENGRDMHLISVIAKSQTCVNAMQALGLLQDQCPVDDSASASETSRRLRGV